MLEESVGADANGVVVADVPTVRAIVGEAVAELDEVLVAADDASHAMVATGIAEPRGAAATLPPALDGA